MFAMCGPYFTCYSYGALIRNKQQVWWGKQVRNLDINSCVRGRSQLGETCVQQRQGCYVYIAEIECGFEIMYLIYYHSPMQIR